MPSSGSDSCDRPDKARFIVQTSWRLVSSGVGRGALNMAVDEALLAAVSSGDSPSVLRFYQWHPAAVSIGYN